LIDLAGIHQQGAAIGVDLVLDLIGVEHLQNSARIDSLHTAVERTVIAVLRPQHHRHSDRDARRQSDQKPDLTQNAEPGHAVDQIALHAAAGGRCGIGWKTGHYFASLYMRDGWLAVLPNAG